ncbi:unnamed protein product [Bemisia tabaci]|uniref:RING-type domain-containing protein n=1 Tax=Bemisia tabaci TaxID=7038 RepID=A0A9P0CGW4_BEMTA|nr:PREDICTED: RING finger protein 121 [Bemisia tabaci]CAH0775031.1 unnamed protein product [Bemisia tabaci]
MIPEAVVNKTEQLTEEEILREEHRKLHEAHRNHEFMHMEMTFIFILLVIVAQIGIVEWKRRHYRSYQLITLAGMWIIPVCLSLNSHYWRFIFFWLVFSCTTAFIVRKAIEKPLAKTTPRLVYKWFYLLYKISYGLGIIGYAVIMAVLFRINFMFGSLPHVWMDCGVLIIFYGLYYGVLGQDCAEICSDKMASHIGYYSPQGISTRNLEKGVCAVCGNQLLTSEFEDGVLENTYRLTCNHEFHEFCIRGWCIVGKKQICPYCKEKVDLKRMFQNPWEKPHVLYGKLLDWIRWLLAWQPVIIFVFQAINYVLGLE